MITENLSTLKINKLSQAQYERELAAGRINPNELYLTPDVSSGGGENAPIYVQADEPIDAPVGAIWVDTSDSLSEYTITNNLKNCTTSNTATTVVNGAEYTATISCTTGYSLNSIQITMGGKDITSTAWIRTGSRRGNIIIGNVTGHVVIDVIADN